MARVFLIVMDSFGIGGAPDAAAFGDEGSNTLGHIAEQCARGGGDRDGLRAGPLQLPNLDRLGLGAAAKLSTGRRPAGLDYSGPIDAAWGVGREISTGKDTPSGHWEIAGLPVPFSWGYFPDTEPCFPDELIAAIVEQAGLPGILGNKHASGTAIIEELGEAHISSGKPIFYTSADSVLQIAAHESHFGLDRLYQLCQIARELTYDLVIGRVIARPFNGESAAEFERTGNRRDYAIEPTEDTLLDRLKAAGRQVIGVGKISDIFAAKGITKSIKASGNPALFEAMMEAETLAGDGDLVFVNFVDFDMLFGHRRDVPGYAAALEAFDAMLPRFIGQMQAGDMAIITADHGCDPSWTGTDHTREQVPILAFGPDIAPLEIGVRTSFADMAQTVAAHLGIAPGKHGRKFL
uniref:phosphopentomutase n=1 Tax=Pararhizobium sp. IMCC3301 TaxID=3067904 RepID=UPI002741A50F|nr:phosphopentomutase [Pararhizobium sp. IMCC3301]